MFRNVFHSKTDFCVARTSRNVSFDSGEQESCVAKAKTSLLQKCCEHVNILHFLNTNFTIWSNTIRTNLYLSFSGTFLSLAASIYLM